MGIKIIENFDGNFTLEPEAKQRLFDLLTNQAFLQQITTQISYRQAEFTELLFQPVPYSTATPKGMPSEFEKYLDSPDYLIINVPPNFMFQAKIFQPSRLCAIYKIVGGASQF